MLWLQPITYDATLIFKTGAVHRDGLHEWVYGYKNTITIVIFTNGLENQ